MKDISFQNRLSRELAEQVKEFEKTLPKDEQVGIMIGDNIIAIKGITALFSFGLIVIQGLCKTASSPLPVGATVRVVLEPALQNLTLIGVPRTDTEPRPPIGFEIRGKESGKD